MVPCSQLEPSRHSALGAPASLMGEPSTSGNTRQKAGQLPMHTETCTGVQGSYNTHHLPYKHIQTHPTSIQQGSWSITPEPHLKVPCSCQPRCEGEEQPHFFLSLLPNLAFSSSRLSVAGDPDPRWEMPGEVSRGTGVTAATLPRLSGHPIRTKKGNFPEWIITLRDSQR